MFRAYIILACLIVSPALAAGISPVEQAAIERAEVRGQLIYDLDLAAWVTTDDLKPHDSRLPRDLEAGGWVVEAKDGGFRVTYYIVRGGRTGVVYVGNVKNGKVISSVFIDRDWPAPTAEQTRMIAALETARMWRIANGMNACTPGSMNSVVIPPAGPADPIDVYFLSPLTENEVPLGGHYLVTVLPEGKVKFARRFLKSCMNVPVKGVPPGAIIGVNHVVDPVPTELHVFGSLQARMPIVVTTTEPESRYWLVDGAHITSKEFAD